MKYNKTIRILIISNTNLMYSESTIVFRGTTYNVESSNCKLTDLEYPTKFEKHCTHNLDLIISETIDFSALKSTLNCLNDSKTDDANLVCKNFFKFHGTFILLNKRYEEFGYSKVYNDMFAYCSNFKEIKIKPKIDSNTEIFNKEISIQIQKSLALETNFTSSKHLLFDFLKGQSKSFGFWLQLLPYVSLSALICFSVFGNNFIDKKVLEWFPFRGSHMYHEFAIVRPVSLIMIIWTCLMYGIFHLPYLFGLINHRNTKGSFSRNFIISFIFLGAAFIFSGLRLFDSRISFDNVLNDTIKSGSFFFTDLMILICLFLVDLVILWSAYSASKSGFVTKREEINLSNIYSVYLDTILLCDLPILFGNLFLFFYENKIQEDSYRFVYSLGTASASLFILQLIYFGINSKSTYDEYLRS